MYLLLIGLLSIAPGQSKLIGDWTTPEAAVVHIYACGAELCAKIAAVSPKSPEKTDTMNPEPATRSRPLCGLQIGSGFKPVDENRAVEGHLYDPESGRTYSGNMEADGAELRLRGYIGISLLGRTEKWQRAHSPVKPCSQ